MQAPQDRMRAKGRLLRRGFAIHAYVGPNGHGKTLAMIYDTLPTLLHTNRKVLSTVRLLDFANPQLCRDASCTYPGHPKHWAAHPNYVPFTDYQQLLDAKNCDVLMDEVTGVASSREHAAMPVQVANFLVQLRRRNVRLAWTAPAWGRADLIIREVTQAVTVCQGTMPKNRKPAEGEAPRLWGDRRLFKLQTFDAGLMEDFQVRRSLDLPAIATQYLWRPWGTAQYAYDTLDAVTSLGWAMDSGMCMVCGGRRSVPRCSCERHAPAGDDLGERRRRRGAGTPRAAGSGGPHNGADSPGVATSHPSVSHG